MKSRIKIISDSIMEFYNPKTKRQEWYSSDMAPGNVIEIKDILKVKEDKMWFVCLDGEHATLPVVSFVFLSSDYLP